MRAARPRLAAELAAKGTPLGMILVDYLQLMRGMGKIESRQQEISEISRSLKGLARDLRVRWSRSRSCPAARRKKAVRAVRSCPTCVKSGALEQDADLVAFIFREEMYKPQDLGVQGKAKITIAKQRNGPTGEFELAFLKEYTKFENLSAAIPEPVA